MNRAQRNQDKYYMRMALSFARRGLGKTRSNPLVGCVLVREGHVVAWGYHSRYGGPHAEVEALTMAGEKARGCTAYVTLEPCSHQGKTPPCAPRLVREGIVRVVVGTVDPNPKVAGKGITILETAGIPVTSEVLGKECRELNRGFFSWHLRKRPYVCLKGALSLDGNIALSDGTSQWITSSRAREMAHLLRSEHAAILVGAGTVRSDNPKLTVRHVGGSSPVPVVVDPRSSLDQRYALFQGGKLLVACGKGRKKETLSPDIEYIEIPERSPGELDFLPLLEELGKRGLYSLLVEGGARVHSSFLRQNLADRIAFFYGTSLLGGGMGLAEHLHISSMKEKIILSSPEVRPMEGGFLVEGEPQCSQDL